MTNQVEAFGKLEDVCGEQLDEIDVCGHIETCIKRVANNGPDNIKGKQFVLGLTKDSLVLVRMPDTTQ